MLYFLDHIPEGIILVKDYKKVFTWRSVFILLFLAVLILLSFRTIDTFKTIVLSYPVLGLLFLTKLDYRDKSNKLMFIGGSILLVVFLIIYRSYFLWAIEFNPSWAFIKTLFSNPRQQWYYQRMPFIGLLIALIALQVTLLKKNRSTTSQFIFMNLFIYLFALSFLFGRYFRPRYASFLNIWHIVVIAIGLFAVYSFLQQRLNHRAIVVVSTVLGLLFFNWNQSLLPAIYEEGGYHPITNEYHDNVGPSVALLLEQASDEDVIVSSVVHTYIDYNDVTEFKEIIRYNYQAEDPSLVIYEAISDYESGWIVIDRRRGSRWERPLPFEDFVYEGKTAEYLGWFGDQFVFKWGK